MNIKSIIIGSLAVGLVVGGTLLMNTQGEKAIYSPRVNSSLQSNAGHAAYMHMLRADPATGLIDQNLVNQAKKDVFSKSRKNNKSALGLNWIQQGPDNVGGRTRAILIDKFNSSIVYAGSVTGGLFVSTDASLSWKPVSGMQGLLGENLSISCLTQTDDGRVFFGTGSTFESGGGNGGSGALGNGVYEYVPATGAVLPVVTNTTAVPNNTPSSFWTSTNAIGSYGNMLYLGTVSGLVYANPDGSGAYPTSFGGWTNPVLNAVGSPEQGRVQDIDIASDGTVLVSFAGKAYVANSGSNNFVRIPTTELTAGGTRWSGAIAPSDPNVMYMLRSSGTLTGLSISQDKGITWTEIVHAGVSTGTPTSKDPFVQNDGSGGQGGYDDAIAVNPGDWGHVIVGGVQLYEWKHVPGTNPIFGSWRKSALLNEFLIPDLYVHADKHTIVWENSTTVYVGSDGGVNKSSDGAQTWQDRNLGYNVTTFYDMNVSANGYIVGGAQDNGTQLITFGDLGEITPLGSVEIQGGDGFDVAFSNLGGLAYATTQFGLIGRYSGVSGGSFYDSLLTYNTTNLNQPFHTVIENWENRNDANSLDSVTLTFSSAGTIIKPTTYNAAGDSILIPGDTIYAGETIFAGDTIHYTSLTNGIELFYVVPADIVTDTLPYMLKLIDPLQNRFVTRTSQGIYLTRDAARLNLGFSEWFKIAAQTNIENFEFSPDGDKLFMGSSNGSIYRVNGLSSVTSNRNGRTSQDSIYTFNHNIDQAIWDATITIDLIANGLGGVVSMAVDPNDGNNMIATSTSYNTGDHVYRCTNALTTTTSTGNFIAIQGGGSGSLPRMPVYDAEVDYSDNDKVIIGTEWGVWTTDNAFSAGSGASVVWTDESGEGMAHVPVFAVEQQRLNSWESVNSGVVYLGTHGRGYYKATELQVVSVKENEELVKGDGFVSNLNVYPNPMNNSGTLSFNIRENVETTIRIYNLTGSLVKTIDLGLIAKGEHKERFDASALSIGSYIISLESGSERKVAKFIVTR